MSVDKNFPQLVWFQVMTSLTVERVQVSKTQRLNRRMGSAFAVGAAECDTINSPQKMAKIMAQKITALGALRADNQLQASWSQGRPHNAQKSPYLDRKIDPLTRRRY